MSADTDVRGRVGLPQPLTMRSHTWKCDGWTLDGHYPRTLQPALSRLRVSVGHEGGWTPPRLRGTHLSCTATVEATAHRRPIPGRSPCLLAGRLAGPHPLDQSGELTLSHIQHMYMTFCFFLKHYLQALWLSRDYYELIENHVGCLQYCFRSRQSALVNNHQFFRVTKSEGLLIRATASTKSG